MAMFIQSADLAELERDTLEFAALSGRKGGGGASPPPPGAQFVQNPAVQATINEVQRLQALVAAGTHEVYASPGSCPPGFSLLVLPDKSAVCMREKTVQAQAQAQTQAQAPTDIAPPPMPVSPPAPYSGGGGGGGGGGGDAGGGGGGGGGPVEMIGGEAGAEEGADGGQKPPATAGAKKDDDEDRLPGWVKPVAGLGIVAAIGAGWWFWKKSAAQGAVQKASAA